MPPAGARENIFPCEGFKQAERRVVEGWRVPRGPSAHCHILTFRSIMAIRGRFHLRPDSERSKNTNTWKRARWGACAHPQDAGYSLIISVRRRIACPTEHISPSPFSISAFLHSEKNFNFVCVATAAAAAVFYSGPSSPTSSARFPWRRRQNISSAVMDSKLT